MPFVQYLSLAVFLDALILDQNGITGFSCKPRQQYGSSDDGFGPDNGGRSVIKYISLEQEKNT